jgi:hypothetical protein
MYEILPEGKSKSQFDPGADLDRSCVDLDPRVWGSAPKWYQSLTLFVYCMQREREEKKYSNTYQSHRKSSLPSVAEKRGTFLSHAIENKRQTNAWSNNGEGNA